VAIVTVKYQVVIPQALRQKLGIIRGDVLEAKVERGRLTYTPRIIADRLPADKADREGFLRQLRDEAPAWLKQSWAASKRNGTDKLAMRQIETEVAAVRRRRVKKGTDPA
jgi:bifunctional DNA-binding transcriptional regulator/antitoxin component of YhaV-PrlF toxin-antitoxin module